MITGTLDGHAAELPDRARTTSEACTHILTAKSDCGKLTGQSGWRSLGLASGCTGRADVEAQHLLRLTDALGNLYRAEFAGFLAGDIDDPRGLALFTGNQQLFAVC
jgi:hypothetical protein